MYFDSCGTEKMAETAENDLLCNLRICRLCGDDNSNYYDPLFTAENGTEDISTLINIYLPIKVTDDGIYPRWICPGCHLQIESTVQFFNLVIDGQRILSEMYKAQNSGSEKRIDFASETSNLDKIDLLLKIENGENLFPPQHEILRNIATNPESGQKRKRGRPRKPPVNESHFEESKETTDDKNPKDPIEQIEIIGENGRRKRHIRTPVRFRETVQGKELEKAYVSEGVIDLTEMASETDENGISKLDKSMMFFEELIGHVEDEKGVNLGELVMFSNNPNVIKQRKSLLKNKKRTRFICDICKISFVHEQKFLQHRQSHQNVRFECKNCVQSYKERSALFEHQLATDHEGEGIIEAFEISETNINETSDTDKIILFEKSIDSETCLEGFNGIDEIEEAAKVLNELQNTDSENIITLDDELEPENKDQNATTIITENATTNDGQNKTMSETVSTSEINSNETKEISSQGNVEKTRFVCSKCKKGFKSKSLLQRHRFIHAEERKFICNFCGAAFKTKSYLLYHSSMHSGKRRFSCNKCKQTFTHKTGLILHERMHTGEKPYKCEKCGKAFSQLGNMQEHMRIHTGERPFVCRICSKSFKTSSQCRLHTKRHNSDKPLQCPICDKTFSAPESYKIHMRRHNNIKPYKCEECMKSFIELSALRKHSRIHTGEKPFKCIQCDKKFSDRSNLKKHFRVHENKKRILDFITTGVDKFPESTTNPTATLSELALVALGDNSNLTDPAEEIENEYGTWILDTDTEVTAAVKIEETHEQPSLQNETPITSTNIELSLDQSENNQNNFMTNSIINLPISSSFSDVETDELKSVDGVWIMNDNQEKDQLPKVLNPQAYVCDICFKSYSNLSSLRRHIVSHAADSPVESPRKFSKLGTQSSKTMSNKAIPVRQVSTITQQEISTKNSSLPGTSVWNVPNDISISNTEDLQYSNILNDTTTNNNQIIYVSHPDPSNPISNKTTFYVVNSQNLERNSTSINNEITETITRPKVVQVEQSQALYVNVENANNVIIPEDILLTIPAIESNSNQFPQIQIFEQNSQN